MAQQLQGISVLVLPLLRGGQLGADAAIGCAASDPPPCCGPRRTIHVADVDLRQGVFFYDDACVVPRLVVLDVLVAGMVVLHHPLLVAVGPRELLYEEDVLVDGLLWCVHP